MKKIKIGSQRMKKIDTTSRIKKFILENRMKIKLRRGDKK